MKSETSCEQMSLNIMALLDDELDENKIREVKEHLEKCKQCSDEYASIRKVREAIETMKFKKLPEFYWDDYWNHIYNRIERGLSWIFISVGTIIILCFAVWEFLDKLIAQNNVHPLLKIGIFILREKIMVRRVDKYREIKR